MSGAFFIGLFTELHLFFDDLSSNRIHKKGQPVGYPDMFFTYSFLR